MFIVLALAATAVRVTVLPSLARAREAGRLSSETASYTLAVGIVAVPLLLLTVVAARPIAELLTGFGPDAAVDAAAAALPWMVVAGLGQFTAGLLASTLAALDDYVLPALAFIVGSVTGLLLLLARIDESRTEAVAWGMALNAVLATTLMALWLWRRARRERMPAGAARADVRGSGRRLVELGSGAALPFALQATYLVCLPIAAQEGVGSVTSFSYAYLIAAAVVGISASSVGLVTAVPLTRLGLEPRRVARHVEASSWPALLVVAATAGIFAVAGARDRSARARQCLRRRRRCPDRAARRGDGAVHGRLGRAVGHVPARLRRRARRADFPSSAPPCSRSTCRSRSPARRSPGSTGSRSRSPSRRRSPSAGCSRSSTPPARRSAGSCSAIAVVAGCAVAGFVPAGALLGPAGAAAAGLVLSAAVLALVRPVGLRSAWHYLRELA